MGLTNYGEEMMLDALLNNNTSAIPSNLYVALYTVAPADTGGGTEVTGGGYTRILCTFGTSGVPRTNSVKISFPVPSANWGTVLAFGLFDASTGGNLVAYADLSINREVGIGSEVYFDSGELSVTID